MWVVKVVLPWIVCLVLGMRKESVKEVWRGEERQESVDVSEKNRREEERVFVFFQKTLVASV